MFLCSLFVGPNLFTVGRHLLFRSLPVAPSTTRHGLEEVGLVGVLERWDDVDADERVWLGSIRVYL